MIILAILAVWVVVSAVIAVVVGRAIEMCDPEPPESR